MLPASWKPVEAGKLIRLGSQNDGGYVVSERAVDASQLLLSMGVNDDWQFEADFRRRSGARVVCFDHSVDLRFWGLYTLKQLVRLRLVRATRYLSYRRFFNQPGVEHRRIKIGYDVPGGVTLSTLLRQFPDERIFLKIDIEGSEYRILDEIVAGADRFLGIIIEFHDIDLHRVRIDAFMASLPDFTVVFFHANNYGGIDEAGDPIVVEMALVRSDFVDNASQADEPVPTIAPNDPHAPEIIVEFEAA